MPKLTLLVGLPASGKSTWIKKNIQEEIVLSTDDYCDSFAVTYGITYNEAWRYGYKMAEYLMWADAEIARRAGSDVFVDRTNTTIAARKKFIDFFKSEGYIVDAIYFQPPPMEEWDRRLASRPGKIIPGDAIRDMAENLSFPSPIEGIRHIEVLNSIGEKA